MLVLKNETLDIADLLGLVGCTSYGVPLGTESHLSPNIWILSTAYPSVVVGPSKQ